MPLQNKFTNSFIMPTMCQLKTISKTANPDADYFFALCWVTAVKCKVSARYFVCINSTLEQLS